MTQREPDGVEVNFVQGDDPSAQGRLKIRPDRWISASVQTQVE